ncbi:hypothetical protein CFC21_071210 [Triticum aestivum]|uniref:F-box domain-containing protein n=3 Tax=Triticum TaxID=4564 RepID=A0A9R0X6S9_TRITD|nr:uncharacterized protein LOC119308697 [Triticum dicoccoides]XP_044388320.1 uncharacterized protein LOC123111572 [Triticum aestivum]KAF7065031.1 hypothetical protein CFC21_071210 [Triticum aestivum]VAI31140.1 unnamed protein product [Triticum turgidum subsp. durum]
MAGPSLPTPPPVEEPQTGAAKSGTTVDALTVDTLRNILRRLALADLLRAALVCHHWRRVAARCLPRTAPLLGYFFHPTATGSPPPMPKPSKEIDTPAVFAPLDASSPNLSLDFAPGASRYVLHDCHQGLLLLEPFASLPKGTIPRFLVLDPATRRRVLLPPPPRDTVPDDHRWRRSRYYVGSALLSRAHPSKLCFEVVCFAIDGGHPRAWVASVDDGRCSWRAHPRTMELEVDFDPWLFESRCVHAAGKIYWHICNSYRMLVLDPATLHLSYLLAPAVLSDHFCTYRVGETPEDGRLCLLAVGSRSRQLQLWVRGEARGSDNGWFLEREMLNMRVVWDAVPGLPNDLAHRIFSVWPSDMDAGRTGKVFIRTIGYGRYSLHLDTAKIERLHTKHGKEYGHPIYAYFLAWPPAFLAPEY